MKLNRQKIAMITNIMCIVLMVALVASLFLPSWEYVAHIKTRSYTCENCGYNVVKEKLEDEFTCPDCDAPKKDFDFETIKEDIPASASIMEFTWMAYANKDLTKQFQDQGYVINDIVLAPFLMTLCFALGLVLCVMNITGTWQSVFPTAGSVVMLVSLLTTPVFRQGPSWMLNVILAAALVVVSLVLLAQWIVNIVKWASVPAAK